MLAKSFRSPGFQLLIHKSYFCSFYISCPYVSVIHNSKEIKNPLTLSFFKSPLTFSPRNTYVRSQHWCQNTSLMVRLLGQSSMCTHKNFSSIVPFNHHQFLRCYDSPSTERFFYASFDRNCTLSAV